MEPRTRDFNRVASATLKNERIQENLRSLYSGFDQARRRAADATPDWEAMRDRGRAIRAHTLDNLDYYLEMVEARVTEAGGKVFFAKDASAANRYVLDLARAKGVHTVIKGKSMVSEEMGLREQLARQQIEAVETDLGEYILQLAGQTPFHIVVPAFHMSKQEISELLHSKLGTPRYEEIEDLAGAARRELRSKFIQADMGITGANFVVAETGAVVLVTNEGNGRMCTSMPRTHVAIMGMEKVVPSIENLGVFLRLLVRSATGHPITSYVTFVSGPRRSDDEDGPEEFHLVIMDNGRSRLLRDPDLRESLYCIRCGACLNACPVYRKIGGHAYGWVYPGPIGKVVTPMMTGLSEAKDLPFASTLCGACREVCPIKINIPNMLLKLRNELTEGPTYPCEKKTSRIEKMLIKGWSVTVQNPFLFEMAGRVGSLLQRPLLRKGKIKSLPGPFSGWTRYRDFPPVAARPFRARWREGLKNRGGREQS